MKEEAELLCNQVQLITREFSYKGSKLNHNDREKEVFAKKLHLWHSNLFFLIGNNCYESSKEGSAKLFPKDCLSFNVLYLERGF